MFWLTRPPYLRWAAAAAVVVAAFLWDLRGSSDILYPFATSAIAAGATIHGVYPPDERTLAEYEEWRNRQA